MRQTMWGRIGLQIIFVSLWSSFSWEIPTVWYRKSYLSQSRLLRLPHNVPPAWTLREAARCNLNPDTSPCLWSQRCYYLRLFEIEVCVKESGILNWPKEKKVDCHLSWEKLVQNKQPFKYLRSFHIHTAEGEPLYLSPYVHTTEMDPFLKS